MFCKYLHKNHLVVWHIGDNFYKPKEKSVFLIFVNIFVISESMFREYFREHANTQIFVSTLPGVQPEIHLLKILT
jgi:hypothetical protein